MSGQDNDWIVGRLAIEISAFRFARGEHYASTDLARFVLNILATIPTGRDSTDSPGHAG